MARRYVDPKQGRFHKLDLSQSGVRTSMVSDATLDRLTKYLNDQEHNLGATRILRIVREMKELQAIEKQPWGTSEERKALGDSPLTVTRRGLTVPNPRLRKVSPEKYRREMDISDRTWRLNRELAQYQFLPHVFASGSRRWVVIWKIRSRTQRSQKPSSQLDEAGALQLILDLAKAGYLERLRQCHQCQKWLYAEYRHQNYCSTKCQQKHYARSDEWKAKRRDYMRDYRQRNQTKHKGGL